MERCPQCGFDSPPGFTFCGTCGQRLASSPLLPPAPAAGERRQLTVLFCDIVDSSSLNERLDPEDWRDILGEYHRACGTVIHRFDGHTAQVLGDGLLIYFGFPSAHEDDARRAVLTALAIGAEAAVLDERLRRERGLSFTVRCGIHTGSVVAGDVSVGDARERLAVGQTPNIAARVQGLAAPNTVFVSATTYQLVRSFFECEPLGAKALKGIDTPIEVFRVIGESDVGRFEVALAQTPVPMVGRSLQLDSLTAAFTEAASGRGRGVLVTGEAGVGKSRLIYALQDRIVGTPHRVLTAHASPYELHNALGPLITLLQRVFPIDARLPPADRLAALEQYLAQLGCRDATPLMAHLLSTAPPAALPDLGLSPQRRREQTLDAIVAILIGLAAERPIVYVMEDIHFADPSTLECLGKLLRGVGQAMVLVVLTARPTFTSPWGVDAGLIDLPLTPLSDDDVRVLIRRLVDGRTMPPAVERQLTERADGNPLFAEELTKSVLESGALAGDGDDDAAAALPVPSVPTSLQDSLTARLDRLGDAREVAQAASVIGREFSYDLLLSVYQGPEARLREGLRRLEDAGIVFTRGVLPARTFIFKHALIQIAAYGLLLKSARRSHHLRIAEALVTHFGELAAHQPQLVARHYGEAEAAAPAVTYWLKAAELAWQRSANHEGVSGLQQALALLPLLPAAERDANELTMQMKLGRALTAARGYPEMEVEQAYTRAFDLCERLGDAPQGFFALDGLHSLYAVRGEMPRAGGIGAQMLARAHAMGDPAFLLAAHYKCGAHHLFGGAFAAAQEHYGLAVRMSAEQSVDRFVTPERADVTSGVLLGATLWAMGFPDRADRACRDAVQCARDADHRQSIVCALVMGSWYTWINRGDDALAWSNLEEGLALATEHDLPWWQAMATIWLAVMAAAGRGHRERAQPPAEAIGTAQHVIAMLRGAGTRIAVPDWLCGVGNALLIQGRAEEALAAIDDGLAESRATTQAMSDAELYRLHGLATLQLDPSPTGEADAERSFEKALTIAREQQARSLELRVALTMAELEQRRGRGSGTACRRLAACYGWFTEGFDTPDLRAARAVLDSAVIQELKER